MRDSIYSFDEDSIGTTDIRDRCNERMGSSAVLPTDDLRYNCALNENRMRTQCSVLLKRNRQAK